MEEFLWVEKYRPHLVKDCVLPPSLMSKFNAMVAQKNIPNLLLVGGPGSGKTTVGKAMLEELKCDHYFINGSLKGDINTLRTDISNFASSVSLRGGRKYVILDEADYLTTATQPALRTFMEEYSGNCGFILTANYGNKILGALKSRCSVIDFNFAKDEAPKLAGGFYQKVCTILSEEGIKYDPKLLQEVIKKYYPDFRRTINELQSHSATGELDPTILTSKVVALVEVIEDLKTKNFVKIREWAATNGTNVEDVYRVFYDKAEQFFKPTYVPILIITIGRYQFQQAFVADAEINLAAFLIEVSAEAEWK